VDRAFASVIGSRDARWAMAGSLARGGTRMPKYALFFAWSRTATGWGRREQAAKSVIETQAADAEARAAEARTLCSKKARMP